MATGQRFEKFSEFFNKKGNENIRAEQIVTGKGQKGHAIYLDSLTKSQIKEFNKLDRKYQN